MLGDISLHKWHLKSRCESQIWLLLLVLCQSERLWPRRSSSWRLMWCFFRVVLTMQLTCGAVEVHLHCLGNPPLQVGQLMCCSSLVQTPYPHCIKNVSLFFVCLFFCCCFFSGGIVVVVVVVAVVVFGGECVEQRGGGRREFTKCSQKKKKKNCFLVFSWCLYDYLP